MAGTPWTVEVSGTTEQEIVDNARRQDELAARAGWRRVAVTDVRWSEGVGTVSVTYELPWPEPAPASSAQVWTPQRTAVAGSANDSLVRVYRGKQQADADRVFERDAQLLAQSGYQ